MGLFDSPKSKEENGRQDEEKQPGNQEEGGVVKRAKGVKEIADEIAENQETNESKAHRKLMRVLKKSMRKNGMLAFSLVVKDQIMNLHKLFVAIFQFCFRFFLPTFMLRWWIDICLFFSEIALAFSRDFARWDIESMPKLVQVFYAYTSLFNLFVFMPFVNILVILLMKISAFLHELAGLDPLGDVSVRSQRKFLNGHLIHEPESPAKELSKNKWLVDSVLDYYVGVALEYQNIRMAADRINLKRPIKICSDITKKLTIGTGDESNQSGKGENKDLESDDDLGAVHYEDKGDNSDGKEGRSNEGMPQKGDMEDSCDLQPDGCERSKKEEFKLSAEAKRHTGATYEKREGEMQKEEEMEVKRAKDEMEDTRLKVESTCALKEGELEEGEIEESSLTEEINEELYESVLEERGVESENSDNDTGVESDECTDINPGDNNLLESNRRERGHDTSCRLDDVENLLDMSNSRATSAVKGKIKCGSVSDKDVETSLDEEFGSREVNIDNRPEELETIPMSRKRELAELKALNESNGAIGTERKLDCKPFDGGEAIALKDINHGLNKGFENFSHGGIENVKDTFEAKKDEGTDVDGRIGQALQDDGGNL